MSPLTSRRFLILCAVICFVTAPVQAVTYIELGDAGRLRNTAQPTAANQGAAGQPLSAIFGSLSAAIDVDLFIINITSPGTFSATTVNMTTGFLDTALFLFDANGRPVYANDDGPTTVGSTLPSGNTFSPQSAGLYYLAVSSSGAEPVNSSNITLFASAASTEVRGPSSATGPLSNWDTSALSGGTPATYEIDLTGATTAAVPEPTTLALAVFGAAGLVGFSRKRSGNS